jgi:hypothetical protein
MSRPSTVTLPEVGRTMPHVDEGGLAGAVGAEQGENLAAADVDAHRLQGGKPGGVGLGQPGDRDHRRKSTRIARRRFQLQSMASTLSG